MRGEVTPNGLVVRNIGFDGNVRHGMLGAGAVPVLDVRSNLNDVAFFDAARRLAAFLIKAFAGENQKNLTASVFVPESAAAGLKCHVAERTVEYRLGVEHRETGRAREEFAVRVNRALWKDRIEILGDRSGGNRTGGAAGESGSRS